MEIRKLHYQNNVNNFYQQRDKPKSRNSTFSEKEKIEIYRTHFIDNGNPLTCQFLFPL